jgi:hypothetical protein
MLSSCPAREAGAEVSRPAKMFERTGELSLEAEPGREFFAAPKALAVCLNPAETASRACEKGREEPDRGKRSRYFPLFLDHRSSLPF